MLLVFIKRETPKRAARLAIAVGLALSCLAGARGVRDMVSLVSGKLKPVYRVTGARDAVALTFDIGWGEVSPGRVLDVLRSKGVRSTFFLSGPWAAAHPDTVTRIAREGHEVASHGYHHDNYSQLSRERIVEDLRKTRTILTSLAGSEAGLLRPPNGDFDDESIAAAAEQGYVTVIWSLDSHDWMNPGVDYMVSRLRAARAGDIILCHASDSARETYLALPAVIDSLREKGLRLVTVTELLALAGGQEIILPDRSLLR